MKTIRRLASAMILPSALSGCFEDPNKHDGLLAVGDSLGASDVAAEVVTTVDATSADLPPACTPGGCDDSNPCTADSCDKTNGCVHLAQSGACTIAGGVGLCAAGACRMPGPCTGTDAVAGGTKSDTVSVARRIDSDFADGPGWALVGTTWSQGGGKNDAWLARLDATGKLKWEQTLGGANLEEGLGLAVLPAKATGGAGFAIAGLTDCLGCGATAQVWRTDSAGKLTKTWSGPKKSSRNVALWIEPAVGVPGLAVAGCTGGDATFAVDWLTADAASAVWSKTYAGNAESCVRGMAYSPAVDGGGEGLLVTGFSAGGRVVRLGMDGTLQWNLESPGTKAVLRDVLALPDGGALAVGQIASINGSLDLWLVRIDGAGKLVADSKLGGTGDDVGYAIAGRADGGFTLAGNTRLPGQDGSDGWVIAHDAYGAKLWSQTLGGIDGEELTAIVAGSSPSQVLVAGHTKSKGAGDWDAWWLPLQTCDDGNACTADTCAAGNCAHQPLPDATTCGGNGQCSVGACVPKPLKITWQEGENLPAGRDHHAVCIAEGRMYVLGGSSYLDTVLSAALDPATGEPKGWSKTATLKTPLEMPAAWVAGGYLYVAGGIQGSSQDVSAVRSAALGVGGVLGPWTDLTALPTAIYAMAPALVGDKVYLVGGGGSKWFPTVRYNTLQPLGQVGTSWSDAKALPQPANGGVGSALPIGGRLWLFGPAEAGSPGKQVLAALIETDGSLGDWQPMGALPVSRQSRAVYLKGRVWIAGGSNAAGDLDSVLTAAVGDKLGAWEPDGKMAPLPGQAGFSAQTVGWKHWVYVVGGGVDKTRVWRGRVE